MAFGADPSIACVLDGGPCFHIPVAHLRHSGHQGGRCQPIQVDEPLRASMTIRRVFSGRWDWRPRRHDKTGFRSAQNPDARCDKPTQRAIPGHSSPFDEGGEDQLRCLRCGGVAIIEQDVCPGWWEKRAGDKFLCLFAFSSWDLLEPVRGVIGQASALWERIERAGQDVQTGGAKQHCS